MADDSLQGLSHRSKLGACAIQFTVSGVVGLSLKVLGLLLIA